MQQAIDFSQRDIDAAPLKRCLKCGEEWPADGEFFFRSARRKDGLAAWCRACWSEYHHALRQGLVGRERKDRGNSMIQIGQWIRREKQKQWHFVESVIDGDAVTRCGRRMRETLAGKGLETSVEKPDEYLLCQTGCRGASGRT
jgi:hypothetical protein